MKFKHETPKYLEMKDTYTKDEAVELMRLAWVESARRASLIVTGTYDQENELLDTYYTFAKQRVPILQKRRKVLKVGVEGTARITEDGGVLIFPDRLNKGIIISHNDVEELVKLIKDPWEYVPV